MDGSLDSDRGRQWFFWGMVLAWMPLIPLLIGLFNAFRGIPTEKATGLAAVAAIVQLGRSWSGASGMRALFALLSICWSAFVLNYLRLGRRVVPRRAASPERGHSIAANWGPEPLRALLFSEIGPGGSQVPVLPSQLARRVEIQNLVPPVFEVGPKTTFMRRSPPCKAPSVVPCWWRCCWASSRRAPWPAYLCPC